MAKYCLQKVLIVSLFFLICFYAKGQSSKTETPLIGAEVFIEPGQTDEEIDTWFRVMSESGMYLCRIRMFESYMRKDDGTWDFKLFDKAFNAAAKYNVKVYANLFPATPFMDIGGFKFPRTVEHLDSISNYIKNLVTHYKSFPALYGWVLINEPGVGGKIPEGQFTKMKFEEWMKKNPRPSFSKTGYATADFSSERFLVDYNTWFLDWIAKEIRKYDQGGLLHVNNHQIFKNAAEYNFPEWSTFLTSLGGSAHASWHFGYFERNKYAVAMSASSEMIRSGAGNIPWLMTELSGGTTTYSGYNSINPTKEEITQWLWTVIATESKGAIFWCLNPRSTGLESGEWALLDLQNEPSDRMKAATEVIKIINKDSSLFAKAAVLESGIHILYTRESLWTEVKSQTGGPRYEGREIGGVMKSALGYFETLSEMGIQCSFNEISEFDFSKESYKGKTIILAHQIAIPSAYIKSLEEFVKKGGKLIVTGFSGHFNEHMNFTLKNNSPYQNLLGGNIKELKFVSNLFDIKLSNQSQLLPSHIWLGTIKPTTGKSIGFFENEVVGLRNTFGNGEVVWIPSLIGLGARLKDNGPLSNFLYEEVKESISGVPVRFKKLEKGVMMKMLKSGDSYLTLIINKSTSKKNIDLLIAGNLKPRLIFSDKSGKAVNGKVEIHPEETIILKWTKG